MKWTRSVLLLVAGIGISTACLFGQNGPETEPDSAPGYVDSVFHHGQVDSINLYNGQLTVPITIGPTYPIGPKLKLQLVMTYNSRVTDFGKPTNQIPPFVYQPLVGDPALGIGWTFTLGAIKACRVGGQTGNCYFAPDGSSHFFSGDKTQDATQYRLLGSGPFDMWDGDGNHYYFNNHVSGFDDSLVSAPGYVHDFGSGRDGWYISSVTDPFGNTYSVTYSTASAPCWSYPTVICSSTQMQCPAGTGRWVPATITLPGGGSISIGLDGAGSISSFTFPVWAGNPGAVTTAAWNLTYAGPAPSQALACPSGGSNSVSMRQILAIQLPAGIGSYQFSYTSTPPSASYLSRITLPTLGTVDYVWGGYTFFHGRFGLVGGCPKAVPEGQVVAFSSCSAGHVGPPAISQVCSDTNPFTYTDNMVGVTSRTETVNSVGATTTYTQYSFPYGERGQNVATSQRPQSLTVALLPPDADGRQRAHATLFWAAPKISNGQVFPGDRVGADIEERVFDANPNTVPSGSPPVCTVPMPACGSSGSEQPFCPSQAVRVTQRLYEYDTPSSEITNRRMTQQTTFFKGLDLSGSCSGCPFQRTTYSNVIGAGTTWDGNGRHYDKEVQDDQVGNDVRTITTTWTPQNSAPYLPNLFSVRTEDETGAVGLTHAERRYEFLATGFLRGVSSYEAVRQLVYLNCRYPDSAGNLSQEFGARYPGQTSPPAINACTGFGDTMPTSIGDNDDNWGKSYAYQNGLRTSATWIKLGAPNSSWSIFVHTRDGATGWIKSTAHPKNPADLNPFQTTYTYDVLGRVSSVTPPEEATMTISYPTTTQTLATRSGGVGLVTTHEYNYDGLGRLVKERRQMFDSTYAKQFHQFDPAGNEKFRSEWVADTTNEPVTPGVATSCRKPGGTYSTMRPASAPGTWFHCFDPFGKPESVVGSMHSSWTTVDRSDGASFYSPTLEAVTVKCVNGTFSAGACSAGTDSITTTRRDSQGRIASVAEPDPTISPCVSPCVPPVTTYAYDVNSKLRSVVQGGQTRTFVYDIGGFLRQETTPEKGTVTYDDVGQAGNVLQETTGDGIVLTRTYDFAGRLQTLSANGTLYVSNSYDNDGGVLANRAMGKLTQQIGYNPYAPAQASVTEDFVYFGVGGRLSSKSTTVSGVPASPGTVTQFWTYNALGLPASQTLPAKSGDSAVTVTTSYTNGMPGGLSVASGPVVVSGVSYRPHGGLAGWTAANGIATTIAADGSLLPRPASITSGSAFSSGAYSYDGAGNIRSIGSDNYGYDLLSRLSSASVSGSGYTYTYDRWGNQTSAGAVDSSTNRLIAGTYDGRGNLKTLNGNKYFWDALNRQTGYNDGRERYVYSASGERVAKVTYTGNLSLLTISPCRVIDTRGPAGPYGLPILAAGAIRPFRVAGQCAVANDALGISGNLAVTGSGSAGFLNLFRYEPSPNPPTSTLSFGAAKTRSNNFTLGISGNGEVGIYASTAAHGILDVYGYYAYGTAPTWTLTYRDEADRLSTEYTVLPGGTFNRTKNYFYFGNMLVATRDAAGAYRYYATDHLGTARGVTDAAGNLVETHKYQPYGVEIGGTFGATPVKFAAMERDATTTNDYDHARVHVPGLGRFLSPDPVAGWAANPISWNLYLYGADNPLSNVDPLGYSPESTTEPPKDPCVNEPQPCVHESIEVKPKPPTTFIGALSGASLGPLGSGHFHQIFSAGAERDFGNGKYFAGFGNYLMSLVTPASRDETLFFAAAALIPEGMGGRALFDAAAKEGYTAEEFIAQFKKGSVTAEFPGGYLKEKLTVVKNDAAQGIADARKAMKLLIDNRFKK